MFVNTTKVVERNGGERKRRIYILVPRDRGREIKRRRMCHSCLTEM